MGNIIEKLQKLSSKEPSKFVLKANWRKTNKYWLDYSRKVAIKLNMTLSDKNITIEEFAKLIGTTTENASLMVKGEYNFTIRELAKIESELKINLLII